MSTSVTGSPEQPSPAPGTPPPPSAPAEEPRTTAASRPVKQRRRPLLFVAMIALVCAGALLSAWAYLTASDAESVLAVRETVNRGEVIEEDDLVTVQVGLDPALSPLAASTADDVVGRRAATDLPGGSLITEESVTDAILPEQGQAVVGVSLAPAMKPAEPLYAGDTVRIVATPGEQGELEDENPDTTKGTVVGVQSVPETGQMVVDVSVPRGDAAELAARAASGRVALVLDTREK